MNHAIHMLAVTQIRHRTQPGPRVTTTAKIAEGKHQERSAARVEATDQRRASTDSSSPTPDAADRAGPGGQPGNDSDNPARPAEPLNTGTSEQPLPDPTPTLRPHRRPATGPATRPDSRPKRPLDNKEGSIGRGAVSVDGDVRGVARVGW